MRREGQGDPEGAVKGWRLRGPGLRQGQKPQRWDVRPIGHQSPSGVLGGQWVQSLATLGQGGM